MNLGESGARKLHWVKDHMKVLKACQEYYKGTSFEGIRVLVTCHLEAKTVALALALKEAGATVVCTGSNPLSTQDDVVAAARLAGLVVFAHHNCTDFEYIDYLDKALDYQDNMPTIIVDDGGDMIKRVVETERSIHLLGSTEETTTGISYLKKLAKEHKLPASAVLTNNSRMKHFFDNKYGTMQSTLEGIQRATNMSIAGKTVVVAGYGWCGKGVAQGAKALGANVIVTEVNPIKAVDAVLNGYRVMPMAKAARLGDIFITVTGNKNIITKSHMRVMKDGAILCNSGHFDCEIQIPKGGLEVKPGITKYNVCNTKDGWKDIYILGKGRLVNLACGDGHPIEIMDMSFAAQYASVVHILENFYQGVDRIKSLVYLDERTDHLLARLKLDADKIYIDHLKGDQLEYLGYDPSSEYGD